MTYEHLTQHQDIEVQLSGSDGGAFAIIGTVGAALRDHGVDKAERTAYVTESMSGDYDHLLQTAMWVVSVS